MAEGSKVKEVHRKNLANLCRIFGNCLKKPKETYQTTYSCKDHREFLEKKFQINTEKDDTSIHLPRFCNLCYRTHTWERFNWKIHTDENSSNCEKEEKAKRSRLKKSKRGGGKHIPKQSGDKASINESTQTTKTVLMDKIATVKDSTTAVCLPMFLENFEFTATKKEELFCPICKEVLEKPIETVCRHYTCPDCLTQAIDILDGLPSCPICKTHLTYEKDLWRAPRVFIQLTDQQSVWYKACKCELQ